MHRRGGKDKTIFNWCINELVQRPQTCYYCLPEFSHGRRVIWDNIDNSGFPLLGHIPPGLANLNKQEMKITFWNGSIFQLVGADSYDKLVGANPKIVVFSEYAITNARAWEYLRPILDNPENKGVAIFISTPRGKNHFYDMYQIAKADPENWFCQIITNNDTNLLSAKDLERLRREGMSEDMIQQEFFCSFSGTMEGSYYGRYISTAEQEGRIGPVSYDNNHLVYTAWDIGIGDSMSIVFFQLRGDQILIIDHYENRGHRLSHYIDELRNRSYQYGGHFVPHDAGNRSPITGGTFVDAARELQIDMTVIPNDTRIEEGIEIVRGMFQRLYIDNRKCEYLLKCLQNYAADYDEKNKVLKPAPRHDWTSHTSDAVRYMCLAIKKGLITSQQASEWSNIKQKYNYYGDITPQPPPHRFLR